MERRAGDAGEVAEDVLVAHAASGDKDAFAVLYSANVDVVFGFLRFRVGEHKAEDLTAETFCRAFASLPGYEVRGAPLRAWLLRIAYNLLVSESRRRSSSEVVTDEVEPVVIGPHDDAVLDSLEVRRMREMLRALAPAQAAAVELRYLRDLTVAEAAVVLDTSEEAVRALTYRGLKTLRRTIDGAARASEA